MKSFFDTWKHKEIYNPLVEAYKNVNLESDYCAKCKTVCCKEGPCNYYPEDFPRLSPAYLKEALNTGNISIKATFIPIDFTHYDYVLYLRARGINRNVVDLISTDTPCKMLKSDGCTYNFDSRPTGGTLMIPKRPKSPCEYPGVETEIFIKSWLNHQIPLKKMVNHLTGNDVDKQIILEIKGFLEYLKNQTELNKKEKELLDTIYHLQTLYKPLTEAVLKREITLD